jgi:hypothetical protein
MDPGYILYAMSCFQDPMMHEAAAMVLGHASDAGLYSEYYKYHDGSIIPFKGTLRPWESAVCGHALLYYLVGLHVDLLNGVIHLQPHLPYSWDGWESRKIDIYNEGSIQITLNRNGDNVELKVSRFGGRNSLGLNVTFCGFGENLEPVSAVLKKDPSRADMLHTSLFLNVSDSCENAESIVLEFRL